MKVVIIIAIIVAFVLGSTTFFGISKIGSTLNARSVAAEQQKEAVKAESQKSKEEHEEKYNEAESNIGRDVQKDVEYIRLKALADISADYITAKAEGKLYAQDCKTVIEKHFCDAVKEYKAETLDTYLTGKMKYSELRPNTSEKETHCYWANCNQLGIELEKVKNEVCQQISAGVDLTFVTK